jgi:two-component system, OmpR family, sensor histidine kinase VicK
MSSPLNTKKERIVPTANNTSEILQIITGAENITNFVLQHYLMTEATMDVCLDFNGPSVVATDMRTMKGAADMAERGIRLRLITDITKENIRHCKEIMKITEVRHLDGIKGNFGILDGREYNMHIIHQESQAPTQMIYSNVKSLADAQQFLFNTLWDKAIPAEQRIREVEEGIRPDFIEIIRDPIQTIRVSHHIVTSASEEIRMVLPTTDGFNRLQKIGVIQLLKEAARRGVRTRILIPKHDGVKESMQSPNETFEPFDIRSLGSQQETKSMILISDSKFSLAIDLKDGVRDDPIEAFGLASYSNTESTLWTYSSIFEKLWIQLEKY